MTRFVVLFFWLCVIASPALSHEARPAYLQLQQVDAHTYEVFWKVPALAEGRRLGLDVEFADDVVRVGPLRQSMAGNAFVQRWRVRRPVGLEGAQVRIAGLESTQTDVLVRVERLDGTSETLRVMPDAPQFVLRASPSRWNVARSYLALGVGHILSGIDHLLFVLALVILVRDRRRLIWTITAFTVAHSMTLAAATLGWVQVPAPPVEASIALSIVFLASEIAHSRAGRPGLTSEVPWIVAFLFGLLHGLGFAGALGEAGLPANAIPLALLFFNAGVEIGQLLFIAAVLAFMAMTRRMHWKPGEWSWRIPSYAIGTAASFWTIQRLATF
ncbi:MAG: HupE/UreJ family protein [Pseudoxanthomonas sp.]